MRQNHSYGLLLRSCEVGRVAQASTYGSPLHPPSAALPIRAAAVPSDRDPGGIRTANRPEAPPPDAKRSTGLTVAEVFEKYLDWCQKHRAGRTYDWYLDHVQSFVDSLTKPAVKRRRRTRRKSRNHMVESLTINGGGSLPGPNHGADSVKNGTLVIIPCGSQKIWERNPAAGPTEARDAYISWPFRANREYAEKFGEAWSILSAKYGFIEPTFRIPGPYNVTFKNKGTGAILTDQLREQARRLGFEHYAVVIGLGGKEYRRAVMAVFDGTPVQLQFPFSSGLRGSGDMGRATRLAIARNDPLFRM